MSYHYGVPPSNYTKFYHSNSPHSSGEYVHYVPHGYNTTPFKEHHRKTSSNPKASRVGGRKSPESTNLTKDLPRQAMPPPKGAANKKSAMFTMGGSSSEDDESSSSVNSFKYDREIAIIGPPDEEQLQYDNDEDLFDGRKDNPTTLKRFQFRKADYVEQVKQAKARTRVRKHAAARSEPKKKKVVSEFRDGGKTGEQYLKEILGTESDPKDISQRPGVVLEDLEPPPTSQCAHFEFYTLSEDRSLGDRKSLLRGIIEKPFFKARTIEKPSFKARIIEKSPDGVWKEDRDVFVLTTKGCRREDG